MTANLDAKVAKVVFINASLEKPDVAVTFHVGQLLRSKTLFSFQVSRRHEAFRMSAVLLQKIVESLSGVFLSASRTAT
nr:hypothetical protein CFP56_28762 [Quercus suber]